MQSKKLCEYAMRVEQGAHKNFLQSPSRENKWLQACMQREGRAHFPAWFINFSYFDTLDVTQPINEGPLQTIMRWKHFNHMLQQGVEQQYRPQWMHGITDHVCGKDIQLKHF